METTKGLYVKLATIKISQKVIAIFVILGIQRSSFVEIQSDMLSKVDVKEIKIGIENEFF